MRIITASVSLLTLASLACENSTGPLMNNVLVSFATRHSAAAVFAQRAATLAAASDTLTDGTNTLVITKAEIVLREIELKQPGAADCAVEPQPAGCEDVEVGPVVVELPLGPGAQPRFAVAIQPGSYNAIEFEIHKVTSADPATFRQQYPYLVDQSVRVQGTYNGQAFTFLSDLVVERAPLLTPLLVVTDTGATNVTILVSLAGWFRGPTGKLVDPASGNKGGQNESVIRGNLESSMKAFEDRDFDGEP